MPKLSVTIITLDEADHIAAALESAAWADEIVVVDSGSRDGTPDLARAKGARVVTRDWPGYVDQKNYAAEIASHDWILSLDADERIPPALAAEIGALLSDEPPMHAYRIPRVTYHLGRWIRTTDFYPDYQTRLYDRRAARWRGRYVHESVDADGPVGRLRHELEHYSYRDLRDHLDRVNRYTTLAARQMHEAGRRAGPIDLLLHPPAAFARNFLLRRGFLDGTAGLTISAVNAYAVFLKFAKLWELQNTAPAGTKSCQEHEDDVATKTTKIAKGS
ncbi:MAG: glycosyltransferase family 2 protein [Acidobacteria bacterium]|nr:glycosyltransferase family 2 protein [Acidobacteriota bacterium]